MIKQLFWESSEQFGDLIENVVNDWVYIQESLVPLNFHSEKAQDNWVTYWKKPRMIEWLFREVHDN